MKLRMPKFLIEATGHILLSPRPCWFVWRPNIHKVKGSDVRRIIDVVEPGDILLRRFDGYLNTLLTKGYFSHAGTYVGNNNVVHSVSQGCICEDILNFCRADAVCVLRSKNLYPEAVAQAQLMAAMNVPYDYQFSSINETYYCTETVDMVHNHMFTEDYTTVAGNCILTPDGIFNSSAVERILTINYKGG